MKENIPSNSPKFNDEYRTSVFDLIKNLTGTNNLLTIPKEFVKYTGSLDAALFLSQLLYWTDKGSRPDNFIYKTYKEWQDEIFLSEYEIRKATKLLIEKGILETKIKKANGSPTLHYRLNKNKFSESILEFLNNRSQINLGIEIEEIEESLTDNTADNTTKNTSTTFPPRGGKEKVIDKSFVNLAEEILEKIKIINPIIPNDRLQNDAMLQIAEHVLNGEVNLNEVIYCAENIQREITNTSVVPTSILKHLGTWAQPDGSSMVDYMVKSQQVHYPDLYEYPDDYVPPVRKQLTEEEWKARMGKYEQPYMDKFPSSRPSISDNTEDTYELPWDNL